MDIRVNYDLKKHSGIVELREAINNAKPGDYVLYSCRRINDNSKYDIPVVARIESVTPYKDYFVYITKPNLTVKFVDGSVTELFKNVDGALWLSSSASSNYAHFMPDTSYDGKSSQRHFVITFCPASSSAIALGSIERMNEERDRRNRILKKRKEEEELEKMEAEQQRRESEEMNDAAAKELDDIFR